MILSVGVALLAFQGPPGDSLTVDAAIALALARRGQVVAAAAGIAAARANYRGAGAVPNPIVSYSFTQSVPRDHASLDQPLDWLLRRGPERAAARAGIASAAADSVRLVAAVVRDARSAFFAALAANRLLELGQEESAIADSLARVASRRFSAGEISQFERAQADFEAARTRQLVSERREAREQAVAGLARAVGIAAADLPPVGGALDQGLPVDQPPAPGIEELPLVRQAVADSVAAAQDYRALRRARIPIPSLLAGVEWNDPSVPDQDLFAVVGMSLPLPLWQRGGPQTAAAAARAERAAALTLEARAETTRLLNDVRARLLESGSRATSARDTLLPLAQRQRDLALASYRAGETGVISALDALRSERQATADLIRDLLAYQLARSEWLELLGQTR